MENNHLNKRKCERIPIDCKVKITIVHHDENKIKQTENLCGEIINISAGAILTQKSLNDFGTGGMLIKLDKDIPINTILFLSFELPFEFIKEYFIVKAKVVYNFKKDSYYEIGVSFLKIMKHYTESKDFEDINYLLNL